VDAAVLEVPAEHATHPDVVRQPGHASTQAADPADDHVDLHAGGARTIERLDHRGVGDRVRLDGDPALGAVLDLTLDELQDPRAEIERSCDERVVVLATAVAGEVIEE